MPGSWHLYEQGQRWRTPRHLLRALVAVPGWEAVCCSAPTVQTYHRDHPGGALGTDLDPVGFFFQAEDGIRPLTVTGVQTCALPISPRLPPPRAHRRSASAA